APSSETARIDFMAERLMSRPLRPKEEAVAESSLKDFIAHYKANEADAEKLLTVGERKTDPALAKPVLAGYAMLANELMNLDEVLNK
ncbi:MAG TPA: hypothetical protein VHH88_09715, partial [Verrucomicrobiae bacterium]|nr:hypothetical protein [Verrucomicrobiae bacterium]